MKQSKNQPVRVDVEFVQALKTAQGVINRLPFEDIVWYVNGKPRIFSPADLDQFRVTGLSNVDFVDFIQC